MRNDKKTGDGGLKKLKYILPFEHTRGWDRDESYTPRARQPNVPSIYSADEGSDSAKWRGSATLLLCLYADTPFSELKPPAKAFFSACQYD